MKSFMRLLVAACFLFLPALSSAQDEGEMRTEVVPENMTAGELAAMLGVEFPILRQANSDIIFDAETELKAEQEVFVPMEYKLKRFYSKPYGLSLGYEYLRDEQNQSPLLFSVAGRWLPFMLNKKLALGLFGSYNHCVVSTKDNFYDESSRLWSAGLTAKWQFYGYHLGIDAGYGQRFQRSLLASGLQTDLFAHFLSLNLIGHFYSNRQFVLPSMFRDVKVDLSTRVPLKEPEKAFWPAKWVHPDLLVEYIKLQIDWTFIDWQMGKKFMIGMGVMGNWYEADFLSGGVNGMRSYYTAGFFLKPFDDRKPIGSVGAYYQNGSTINFQRWFVAAEVDLGFFYSKLNDK